MKKFIRSLLAFTALAFLPTAAGAQTSDEPLAITLHSDAYRQVGPTNLFSILLGSTEDGVWADVDFGSGLNEYQLTPAYIDTNSGEWVGTYIPAHVNEAGIIKIYCDPAKIDVLIVNGGYITDIEMPDLVNLDILDLQHNALQSLDLTPFTKLRGIYLTDNPFTKSTPLIIGTPKNDLQILEIDIIDWMDPNFNFSDYPALLSADAYANYTLSSADVSNCPLLRSLSLEMTQVSTLDVTNNPNLIHLNISESRITDIDLSKNPQLQRLLASHTSGSINTSVKLKQIDLSNNPLLIYLDLTGNNLPELDLSHNPLLTNLLLARNSFTSLDLTNNINLYSVNVMYNNMNFATLPYPDSGWGEYFYLQNDLQMPRSVLAGAPIDFSGQVLREGTETYASVYRRVPGQNDELIDASLYSFENGIITFPSAMNDSIYVRFSNSLLSEYPLSTTPFMVKSEADYGKPTMISSLYFSSRPSGDIEFAVGIAGASAASPRTFYVDLGSGLQEFIATSSNPAEANVTIPVPESWNMIADIFIGEGDIMTALSVDGMPLRQVDITAATELRYLAITNCNLPGIDMAYNRLLQSIDLSNNNLIALDLSGVYGDFEKNFLTSLKASNNKIETVTFVSPDIIANMDLSNNRLTDSFTFKNFYGIRNLNVSNNNITGTANLTYMTGAQNINLSSNKLTGIVWDTLDELQSIDISNNNFTIQTLPLPTQLNGMVYAPQSRLQIYSKGPAINLSDQNRVVNGNGTNFVWKKMADGSELVEGVDMTCEDGATKFINYEVGIVYCEMTNPAFPQFSGENVFATTGMLVMAPPTNIIASFTTTEDSNDGILTVMGYDPGEIYVDWRGDGSDYMPYSFDTQATSSTFTGQRTFAGATAKLYTYDADASNIYVFSVQRIAMSKFDASPLKQAYAVNVQYAGLSQDNIILPEGARLSEVVMAGNAITNLDFLKPYASSLGNMQLNDNQLTEFNGADFPHLYWLILSSNNISSATFNNPGLLNLSIENNQLETLDVSKLPSLNQLFIYGNKFSEIDLSPIKNHLYVLDLTNNYFTFATTPLPSDLPATFSYSYGGQHPLPIECVDGQVDLSSQAKVGDVPTTYIWFLNEMYIDPDTGEMMGETLYEGEGEEYVIENGITTFLVSFDGQDKVLCVMLNEALPNLVLTTERINVTAASIGDIVADAVGSAGPIDVYNIRGELIRSKVEPARALEGLASGIYIVGGRKVLITH